MPLLKNRGAQRNRAWRRGRSGCRQSECGPHAARRRHPSNLAHGEEGDSPHLRQLSLCIGLASPVAQPRNTGLRRRLVLLAGMHLSARGSGLAARSGCAGQLRARSHRHRIPLGLLMLEQGWISQDNLRAALAAQRSAGCGKIGEWLVRQRSSSEERVTRTLGLQWGCPVLSIDFHNPGDLTALLPRLFVDAFGALPLRLAAGKILYLGFEDRVDPALALAIERMTGLRVEAGLVESSQFRPAHARALEERFPSAGLIEAATEQALAQALGKAIEESRSCGGAPGARARLLLASTLAASPGGSFTRGGRDPRRDCLDGATLIARPDRAKCGLEMQKKERCNEPSKRAGK